ncbi:MAG: hypothetical protein A2729_02110 [Candidatus Buchananbacteria bacterium RIFCSPHIGHO2_01_FULL_39_14]|uniref:Glycosyl transferase family 1 domain-containing protein n=1 Tax=Candidatus Buchananbacteria bacterium RIFCSPHIGHO2_01_FULL_39_14 TaxID=1797532 RepID=A0A1G1XWH6_9BACT|nr:MAG: hypothetical protein A2729_02110 [Candidatus Buchananbacteria bacterium RIFCSPHIGHO2_01_FULL_39_14]
MIKKTLLVTLDFPPHLGGVASFYYNVCKRLPPDKIVVLAPDGKGADDFDHREHFPIIRKKLLNQFPQSWPRGLAGILKLAATVRWVSLIRGISQVVKNHHIELMIAGQVLPIGTLALIYYQRRKIPYIIFAHGLDILLPQNYLRKTVILKKILSRAKAIIANSHFTKDEIIKLGVKAEKIIVINPCPDNTPAMLSEWKAQELREEHELIGKKILLTVGRLVERKGHDLVIKALPEIIKSVPNLIYLIVGDGPNRKNLEHLVNENSLRDYVKFIGVASEKELACFYHLGNVFVMPARQLQNGDVEGFGMVYLEANSFGKPVIGGKSGGVTEAIIDGQTGLLVNPDNVNELIKAVIKLLTDMALAERLGLQGLERVTKDFDWQTQVEKIKEILK